MMETAILAATSPKSHDLRPKGDAAQAAVVRQADAAVIEEVAIVAAATVSVLSPPDA
jgi:hypothetical protein